MKKVWLIMDVLINHIFFILTKWFTIEALNYKQFQLQSIVYRL